MIEEYRLITVPVQTSRRVERESPELYVSILLDGRSQEIWRTRSEAEILDAYQRLAAFVPELAPHLRIQKRTQTDWSDVA